jgi:branched-chain amino acid transport system substrate-binding protein
MERRPLPRWRFFVRGFSCAPLLLVTAAALAQGVTDKEVVIGRTAGFTGVSASPVNEGTRGAMLYINSINNNGGVHGRKIVIEALDDGFEPKRAADNVKKLIEEKQVLAIFFNRGTPHSEAILPIIKEHGVPVIAPSTGAALLHEPVNPLVFNVRSKYQAESEKAIEQLATMGMRKIALVYVTDSFGKDGAEGAMKGFQRTELKPAVVVTYDRAKGKVEDAGVEAVAKADPQAVLVIATHKPVVDFVHALRKAGSVAQVITISNVSSQSLVKDLGEYARGVMVTQVFPNPVVAKTAIAREFQKLAKGHADVPMSYAAMEGFAAAKVLVEGLRRAGPQLNRKRLISALESMRDFNLGDVSVSYGPKDRTGSEYVGLSIIDRRGQFME